VPSLATAAHGADFTDVPGDHHYAAAISDLAARGVVSGYTGGAFRPDAPVSRQQFAKMIARTLGLPVSAADTHPFTDLPANTDPTDPLYPNNYVAVCHQRGLLTPPSPTTFAPSADLSRADLLTAAARAAGLPDPPAAYSPPFAAFSPDTYEWARKAAYAGLLDGIAGMGPAFDLLAAASRGECAQVLHNLLVREQSGETASTADAAVTIPSGDTPPGAATIAATTASDTTAAETPPPAAATATADSAEADRGLWSPYTLAGICVAIIAVLVVVWILVRRAGRARTKSLPPPFPGSAQTAAADVAVILREWGADRNGFSAPLSPAADPESAKVWDEMMESAERTRAAQGSPSGGPGTDGAGSHTGADRQGPG